MTAHAETKQLALALTPKTSFAREAFLQAECNRDGLNRVLAWRGWPTGKLVLSGPAASGKTHLAHIWAEDSGARLVSADTLHSVDPATFVDRGLALDDADRVAGDAGSERMLLHLHNALQQNGLPLLLTSRREPGRWSVALPDLASRIAAAPHARLAPPDDALLAAVLVKLFHDRQLNVEPHLVTWLVTRMDRSLAAARDIVARLDAAAFAERSPVNRRMARAVLDNIEDGPP